MQSFNCGITIRVPIINNYAWFKKNFSRLKSYDRLQSSVQCYQKTYTEQQGSALSLSLSLYVYLEEGVQEEEEERWSSQPGYTNDSLKKMNFLLS